MLENFSTILERYGVMYLQGLWLTVQLSVLSLIIGFFLAWAIAILLASSQHRYLRWALRSFIYFMTGTPLLVQLFLVYYGLGQFETIRESFLWPVLREPYWCALFVFTLNTAAYSANIFVGAMAGEAVGERHAALACGMSNRQIMWRLLLPASWRRALPAYGNEMIFLMHSSAVVSVITLLDITGVARVAARGTFAFSESYLVAIVLYMMLTGVIVLAVQQLEKRLMRHLQPSTV